MLRPVLTFGFQIGFESYSVLTFGFQIGFESYSVLTFVLQIGFESYSVLTFVLQIVLQFFLKYFLYENWISEVHFSVKLETW